MIFGIRIWVFLLLACFALCIWALKTTVTFLIVQPFLGFRPPFTRLMMLELVINFFFVSTPLGSGGVLAAVALVKPYGIKPYRVLAVFAITKFIDAFFIVAFLLLTFFVASRVFTELPGGWVLEIALLMLMLGIVMAWAALVFLVIYPRPLLVLMLWFSGFLRVGKGTSKRLTYLLMRTNRSIRMFGTISLRRKLLIGFASVCHWLLASSGLWLCVIVIGGNIGWEKTVSIQVASAIAGKVASLPGGALASEITALGLLVPVAGGAIAGASILLWRLMTFYLPLLLGALSFFLLSRDL